MLSYALLCSPILSFVKNLGSVAGLVENLRSIYVDTSSRPLDLVASYSDQASRSARPKLHQPTWNSTFMTRQDEDETTPLTWYDMNQIYMNMNKWIQHWRIIKREIKCHSSVQRSAKKEGDPRFQAMGISVQEPGTSHATVVPESRPNQKKAGTSVRNVSLLYTFSSELCNVVHRQDMGEGAIQDICQTVMWWWVLFVVRKTERSNLRTAHRWHAYSTVQAC